MELPEDQTTYDSSVEERETRLWEAAEEYINGNITQEEFEGTERLYEPDLKKAAVESARSNGWSALDAIRNKGRS